MNLNSLKNNRLKNDIEIINNEILKNIKKKNVNSILLYGSYGRNEGAFYLENDKIKPYNDYDILIVANANISKSKLLKIKDTLLSKIGINYIDISVKYQYNLLSLKANIFNYDLKNGSKIIWGDKSILETIPKISKNQIGLIDVETLYFTRQFTFIGVLDDDIKNTKSIYSARFFKYQMAKAIFAIVDSLLVERKKYDSSYIKRIKIITEGNFVSDEFKTLANWALKQKLSPSSEAISFNEFINLYTKVKTIYFKQFHRILSKFYGFKILSCRQIIFRQIFSYSKLIMAIKYIVKNLSIKQFLESQKIIFSELIFNENFDIRNPNEFKNYRFLNIILGFQPNKEHDLWCQYKNRIIKLKFS